MRVGGGSGDRGEGSQLWHNTGAHAYARARWRVPPRMCAPPRNTHGPRGQQGGRALLPSIRLCCARRQTHVFEAGVEGAGQLCGSKLKKNELRPKAWRVGGESRAGLGDEHENEHIRFISSQSASHARSRCTPHPLAQRSRRRVGVRSRSCGASSSRRPCTRPGATYARRSLHR